MKNQTVYLRIIAFVLFNALAFTGCPNGNDDTNNTPSKLAIIDITNASNLFIAPASNGRTARAAGDTNKLFKITDEGYIQEVSYIDENGKAKTDIETPSAVYNAGEDYVIVDFSGIGYLVRKSDGAVFSLKDVRTPIDSAQLNNFKNAQIVQTDSDGNIYYGTYASYSFSSTSSYSGVGLIKINISNPNNLTKINPLPDREVPNYYAVANNGDIAYNYFNVDSRENYGNRIKKANGGLENLPSSAMFWIGLDGSIKYNTSYANGKYFLKLSNRILTVSPNKIEEVENPSNTPREIMIDEITTIKSVIYSQTYYYLSGNNSSNQPVLLKINPQDDSVITLLTPNQYDIYKMTAGSNDVVSFNALRMSDGKKVIGQVSAPGNVNILDEEMNSEMVVLERIR